MKTHRHGSLVNFRKMPNGTRTYSSLQMQNVPLEEALKKVAVMGLIDQLGKYKEQLVELEEILEEEYLDEIGIGEFA